MKLHLVSQIYLVKRFLSVDLILLKQEELSSLNRKGSDGSMSESLLHNICLRIPSLLIVLTSKRNYREK